MVKSADGSFYAAKMLQIVDKKSLDSIIKEHTIHKELKNPYIVEEYKALYVEQENSIALIMEYCEQGSLATHIGKLKSIEIKARLMLEIATGLEYMHNTKKVVHRDLKP